MGARVLIVDDDPMIQRASRRSLERAGFDVTVAGTVWAAQRPIATHQFELALLDYYLDDDCGCALIEPLRRRNQSIRIVVVSGLAFGDLIRHALASGADLVASKVDADWAGLARADLTHRVVRPEVDLWKLSQRLIHGALLVHKRNVSYRVCHRTQRSHPFPFASHEVMHGCN